MTIPPITPPVTPPPTGITENSSIPVGLVQIDEQSAYSADLAAGKEMTIKQFGVAISVPKEQAYQVSFATQQYNANSRDTFYQALAQSNSDLIKIFDNITTASELFSNGRNNTSPAVQTLNNEIDTYNGGISADQDAVNALNDAINLYNSGDITQVELNTAIDDYNAYVNSRNNSGSGSTASVNQSIAEFNSDIAPFNSEINQANSLLALVTGLSSFTGQSAYTFNATPMPTVPNTTDAPPVSSLNFTPSSLPNAVDTTSPQSQDPDKIASDIFGPIYALLSGQQLLSASILQVQSTFQAFIVFFLQGRLPSIPASFYTPTPALALSSGGSGVGAGSGVSMATLVASLSNPLLSGIIEQGIFSANMALQKINVNPYTLSKLRFFTQLFLGQIGLLSGARGVTLLGSSLKGLNLQSKGASLIAGLAFTSEVNTAIASGLVSREIRGILSEAYPTVPANTLDALLLQLASATELFMLQASLFQLSQTLGNPSLLAQLLNTTPSGVALGILNPFSPRLSANDSTIPALQEALINELVRKNNLAQLTAQESVSRTIKQIGQEAFFNGQVDQKTLVDALVQNGLSPQAAAGLAPYGQAFIQAEILGQNILKDALSVASLSKEILASQLVNGLITASPTLTTRQLRDQLANQFVLNGATPSDALLAATAALSGSGSGFTPLTLEALRGSTLNAAIHTLSGVSNAQALANELVSTVLGQNLPGSQTSIRTQIDERLSTLIQLDDKKVTDETKATIQAFLAPTVELYAFAERLRDPANAYIYSAQAGIMYGQTNLPSNSLNQSSEGIQFQA